MQGIAILGKAQDRKAVVAIATDFVMVRDWDEEVSDSNLSKIGDALIRNSL